MIDYLFIFLITILGTAIVWEDVREGKIRNAVISAGMLIGFLLYTVVCMWLLAVHFGLASGQGLSFTPFYFFYVFINFLLAVLCGYLLWRYKVWSAGDAKFFIMLAFLLPLRFYENGYLSYFPSSALLINVFIPIFLFFLLRVIVEMAAHFRKFAADETHFVQAYIERMKKEVTSMTRHKRRSLIVCGTFLLTFLFIPLLKYQTILILPPDPILVFSVFAVFYVLQSYAYRFIEMFMKKKWFVVGLSLFIAGYLAIGMAYFRETMFSALSMVVIMGMAFFIVLSIFERVSNFYIKQNEVEVVQRKDLKPKMVIAEELVENIKSDTIFSQALGELYPEGISKEQVVLLQEWLKERGKEHIPVYKTFSFAPYIFAGAIITIVLKQSVVHLFLSFIHS